MTQSFRASDVTRAIKAAKAANLTDFEVHLDERGMPFIRVGKSDWSEDDLVRELEEWRRKQTGGHSK